MHKGRVQPSRIFLFSLILALGAAALVSCGGNSQPTAANTGTISTFLSDPPTCGRDFADVFVTVTKVTANLNADAGPNDSGWQTLIDLTSEPMQVDLMKLNPAANPNFCGTLFTLGQKVLPAGKYQQIRFYLLSNNPASGVAVPSKNDCGTSAGWNCVVPNTTNGPGAPQELQLPSEVQTGIKIPSSQITNGGLTVTVGQSVDLNIDVQSCASVVQAGNKFLLKPVLHAGEVSMNTNTISGKVVQGPNAASPGTPVPDAIVLLEQPDSTGIDRVVDSNTTQQDGTFAFCPIAASLSGNFDVVVGGPVTQSLSGPSYNPSVVFNVGVGNGTGSIPLYAESGTPNGPATISGQILTSNSSNAQVSGGVQVSALQTVTDPVNSNMVSVTVPLIGWGSAPAGNVTNSQPPIYTTVSTVPTTGCATGTADCVGYSLMVPASDAAVGAYSSSNGNTVAAPASENSATYTINALADGSSSGLLACTSPPSGSLTSADVNNVTPGSSVDQSTVGSLKFTFSSCQ